MWKVRLEDVVRVSFDASEKVIVSGVEQVGDGRHVIAIVTEPFFFCGESSRVRSAVEHMPDHAGAKPRLRVHCVAASTETER